MFLSLRNPILPSLYIKYLNLNIRVYEDLRSLIFTLCYVTKNKLNLVELSSAPYTSHTRYTCRGLKTENCGVLLPKVPLLLALITHIKPLKRRKSATAHILNVFAEKCLRFKYIYNPLDILHKNVYTLIFPRHFSPAHACFTCTRCALAFKARYTVTVLLHMCSLFIF